MTEPTWAAIVSDHGYVSLKELADWVGINPKYDYALVLSGVLPSPDRATVKRFQGLRNETRLWRVKTIRDWIKAGKPRVST